MQNILLKKELEDLYLNKRMTDKEIGVVCGCKEHVIRNLRKKFNINTLDRFIDRKEHLKSLLDDQLRKIILNNNYKGIQNILGLSSFTWKEELKNRGIGLKNEMRINQYPELSQEQIILVIGSLLGDAGIDADGISARFYESHSPKQILYLEKKHALLKPFSCNIYVDKAYNDLFCYRFTTVSHPHFKKFADLFYDPSLTGKLIPLDFIKSVWHDDILAIWFLDDGHFDEKSGCYTIANKCPKPEQLYAFLDFLSDHYQAPFTLYNDPDLFIIKIPLKFRDRFIKIILNVATDDMLYKVPALYRELNKEKITVPEFTGDPEIVAIKSKIFLGYTLEDLQEEYPITKALFLRLGGKISEYVNINHPFINDIIGAGKKPSIDTPLDKEVAVGTILGDGNIHLYGDNTCVFSFAHSLPQAGYVKLKYEFLKSYVNRIRYVKNTNNNYYSFHVLLKSAPEFLDLHKVFYTAKKESKEGLQKYLFREEIVAMITPRVFAFWLMDDGKKYGSGKYMFTITIGKQPYYTYRDFEVFVGLLNDKLGFNLRAREEKVSYEITTAPGMAEEVFHKIKEYIWPYFSYKFGVARSECGSSYKTFPWFSEWED